MGKRKSTNWKPADMKKIEEFIKQSVNAGAGIEAGKEVAAKYFGVSRNAINIKYSRYLKSSIKQPAPVSAVEFITSAIEKHRKQWSKKDVLQFKRIMAGAKSDQEGIANASAFFGRTEGAIYKKWRKIIGVVKRKPTKLSKAVKVSKPKATYQPAAPEGREVVLDIKDIKFDFTNKKITIIY